VPKLFTLRGDPFERADEEGIGYDAWRIERLFALVPAQAFVAQWLQSFKEFPPRQKAATFGIDQVMDKLTSSVAGSN
jgi:arylsulfatase